MIELITTLIKGQGQKVAVGLKLHLTYRLVAKGHLVAGAARRIDAVQLRNSPHTGLDINTFTVFRPVGELGGSDILVTAEY